MSCRLVGIWRLLEQIMSKLDTKPKHDDENEDLDIIIVGAGFAGLYLLDRLRGMGMAVQVFEAGGGLGGVWYWNCYPGACVDSSGPIYQYSHDDLWRKWLDEVFDQLRALSHRSIGTWNSTNQPRVRRRHVILRAVLVSPVSPRPALRLKESDRFASHRA